MYGAIENTQMVPHLQSFFLAWDLNSRTRPFLNDFWNDFQYVVHKGTVIWRYEIGLSTRARRAGLSVKPFVSAATIKSTYGRSSAHPWASRRSGRNNGTLYFWDGLIKDFRFPFLKANLARYNMPWHDVHGAPARRHRATHRLSFPTHPIERGQAWPETTLPGQRLCPPNGWVDTPRSARDRLAEGCRVKMNDIGRSNAAYTRGHQH